MVKGTENIKKVKLHESYYVGFDEIAFDLFDAYWEIKRSGF